MDQSNRTSIKKIEISFRQRDAPGWILIYVKVDDTQHEIWASYCFPPFENLVTFFESIMRSNLPAYCVIDEEGAFECFEASSHEDQDLFYFTLSHSCGCESCGIAPIEGIFEKKQAASEFLKKFATFLSTGYNHKLWADRDLRLISLDALTALIEGKDIEHDTPSLI
ncbi:MAG: hypothetical protein WBA22_11105 [Candidatus Methanofastidiosia archaeon]